MIRYLVNLLVSVLPSTRAFGIKRALWQLIRVEVGQGVRINSGARVWGGGTVSVGPESWVGMNLAIIVPAGAAVTIGANVDIAPDVIIECGSHDIGGPERRAGRARTDSIEIGDGTWIGCRAILLGGAKVGAGSVVAAGALVLPGDYPDNVLLVGLPARATPLANDNGPRE